MILLDYGRKLFFTQCPQNLSRILWGFPWLFHLYLSNLHSSSIWTSVYRPIHEIHLKLLESFKNMNRIHWTQNSFIENLSFHEQVFVMKYWQKSIIPNFHFLLQKVHKRKYSWSNAGMEVRRKMACVLPISSSIFKTKYVISKTKYSIFDKHDQSVYMKTFLPGFNFLNGKLSWGRYL